MGQRPMGSSPVPQMVSLPQRQGSGPMGPPGGGRSPVTQRMQRQFNIISYTEMQFDAITTIFKTILDAFLFNFNSKGG